MQMRVPALMRELGFKFYKMESSGNRRRVYFETRILLVEVEMVKGSNGEEDRFQISVESSLNSATDEDLKYALERFYRAVYDAKAVIEKKGTGWFIVNGRGEGQDMRARFYPFTPKKEIIEDIKESGIFDSLINARPQMQEMQEIGLDFMGMQKREGGGHYLYFENPALEVTIYIDKKGCVKTKEHIVRDGGHLGCLLVLVQDYTKLSLGYKVEDICLKYIYWSRKLEGDDVPLSFGNYHRCKQYFKKKVLAFFEKVKEWEEGR